MVHLIFDPELLLEHLIDSWIDFLRTFFEKNFLWETSVDWERVSVILVLQFLPVIAIVKS